MPVVAPLVTVVVAVLGFFGVTDPDVAQAVKVLITAVVGGIGALHVILSALNHRHRINRTAELGLHQINVQAEHPGRHEAYEPPAIVSETPAPPPGG